jgi:hypothetical protein
MHRSAGICIAACRPGIDQLLTQASHPSRRCGLLLKRRDRGPVLDTNRPTRSLQDFLGLYTGDIAAGIS